ncbi:MAG: transposase [Bacteroidota bacterium]
MFRENKQHLQKSLLSTVSFLSQTVKKLLENSWAVIFYNRIFVKIEEKKFSVLYSNKKSRPNFPVNVWVGLEILKALFDWTDEEMLLSFHFDLLTCYALGIENLGELTLAPRTIYYNRRRLLQYEAATGVSLLEEVFSQVTDDAIRALGIDTCIQRMDSSMISSNIKKMSRLELLVKVLQNLYRDLPEEEQAKHREKVKDYIDAEAGTVSYKLKRSELNFQLQKLGELLFYFYKLYETNAKVNSLRSYRHVGRVLREQFDLELKGSASPVDEPKTSLRVKPPEEIRSDVLQNPADEEATFHRKNDQSYQGYTFNITESCSPTSQVRLITDIAVVTNNTSDEKILTERLPEIKRKTSLNELVVDASYSGAAVEKLCEEEKVTLYHTGIKGSPLSVDRLSLKDFQFKGTQISFCPNGVRPTDQRTHPETCRHVVRFDKERCSTCPLAPRCPVQERRHFYSLYFTEQQMRVAQKRQQFDSDLYRSKQRLRPAVEGTISQFKWRTRNGKLRVRGLRRVSHMVVLMAIAINFRRIRAALLPFSFPPQRISDIFFQLLSWTAKMRGSLRKLINPLSQVFKSYDLNPLFLQ